jgi:hypothetical protein
MLINDLIDMYPGAEPEQKARIEDTLRTLGGNDLPELVSGRGLDPGVTLEAEQDYERDLQEALAELPVDSEL